MTLRFKFYLYGLFLLILLVLWGCSKKEIVPEQYQPTNAFDAYLHGLKQAGLTETALGKDWVRVSEKILREAVDISPPFKEVFYVDPSAVFAAAYRFAAKRGQRIELNVDFKGQKPARLFIDLYRVTGESIKEWVLVASANEKEKRLAFEPRQDAKYVVRLQPELLRGGQYTVTIRNVASLAFPVSGKNRHSIGSKFGAPRDGGRRKHNGVDIFAPRHTPVVSPSKSAVVYVGDTRIGGKVIWLYDSRRNIYLYFAHLQRQDVKKHQVIKTGQVIGTVGNSGNAKTTPPHLHFSVTKRGEGWIDPHSYIAETNHVPEALAVDPGLLGKWVRSKTKGVPIKRLSGTHLKPMAALDRYSPVKVLAAAGKMYRVISPDGVSGYIPSGSVEPIDEKIQQQTASMEQAIKEIPGKDSASMGQVEKGEKFLVLGKFREYWLVKTHNGNTGWMQIPQT
jgi:murein DD-endopeptidase MepM/ murein hydrolase activator NlpD